MRFPRAKRFAVAVAAGLAPAMALACGVCIEDKVATTYDHALASRALASGRVVVFAEVTGDGDAKARVRSARAAAARVPGVERATIRTHESPEVLSFVLDPRARTPEQALALAQLSGGEERFKLDLLKVLR